MFDYDTNYLDNNTVIKNLKYSTVELTERIYVDKPMKRQKDMPMQKKNDIVSSLVQRKLL